MSKKIPPIYKERDVEYIDIVLMFDEATKRLEKSRRLGAIKLIALITILSQILCSFGVVYYYENYSKRQMYEVVGENFYNRFNELDTKGKTEVLKILSENKKPL